MKSVKLGEVMDDSASGDEMYDGGDDADDEEEESDWAVDEERETEARYTCPPAYDPHPMTMPARVLLHACVLRDAPRTPGGPQVKERRGI